MKPYYAREKLGAAVFTLATSPYRIQQRLEYAFIAFISLKEEHFPENLREEWRMVRDVAAVEEPAFDTNGQIMEGRIHNFLTNLTDDQCVELSKRIFELYSSLTREE